MPKTPNTSIASSQIDFYIKNKYGVDHMYVADEALRATIGILTGRKTIAESDIKALETLGFSFNQVLPK